MTNPVSLHLLYCAAAAAAATTITSKISVYSLVHKILTLGPALRPCQNSFKIMFKPPSYFLTMYTKNTGILKFTNKGLLISQLVYAGKGGVFFPASVRHLFGFQEGLWRIELFLSLKNWTWIYLTGSGQYLYRQVLRFSEKISFIKDLPPWRRRQYVSRNTVCSHQVIHKLSLP